MSPGMCNLSLMPYKEASSFLAPPVQAKAEAPEWLLPDALVQSGVGYQKVMQSLLGKHTASLVRLYKRSL